MKRQLVFLEDDRVVDAVVAYRAWEAWAVDGIIHLTSVTRREVEWPRGKTVEAVCPCLRTAMRSARFHRWSIGDVSLDQPAETHALPETYVLHTCGIYAWANPIIPYTPRMLGLQMGYHYAYVVGEVLLWGRVRVHERGYRAEFAKPSAFYVTDTMSVRQRTVVDLAALQWAVPAVRVDGAQYAVERFRQSVAKGHLYP